MILNFWKNIYFIICSFCAKSEIQVLDSDWPKENKTEEMDEREGFCLDHNGVAFVK